MPWSRCRLYLLDWPVLGESAKVGVLVVLVRPGGLLLAMPFSIIDERALFRLSVYANGSAPEHVCSLSRQVSQELATLAAISPLTLIFSKLAVADRRNC